MRRAALPLLRELCRHGCAGVGFAAGLRGAWLRGHLPLSACAIGELMANCDEASEEEEAAAPRAGGIEARLVKSGLPTLLASDVTALMRRLQQQSDAEEGKGWHSLISLALLTSPPSSTTTSSLLDPFATSGDDDGEGDLEALSLQSWRSLIQSLPELALLSYAFAMRPKLYGAAEEALWEVAMGGGREEEGSGDGGAVSMSALLLLRLLHRGVAIASGTTELRQRPPAAAAAADPDPLRHLRWRLSLARTPAALKLVQAEVARLVKEGMASRREELEKVATPPTRKRQRRRKRRARRRRRRRTSLLPPSLLRQAVAKVGRRRRGRRV